MRIRKLLLRIFLAIALLGLLLWGAHQFYPLPLVKVSSFRAVPKYSAYLMAPSSFRETPSPWDAWELSSHWELLRQIESTFGDSTYTPRALAVLQPMGKSEMGWLGIWELDQAEEKLQAWLDQNPHVKARFKNVWIYNGQTKDKKTFAVARFRNLLLAAPFPFLVEDALRQLTSFSLDRIPVSRKTGPYALQPSQVPVQWTTVLSENGRPVWDLFRDWTGWADLSLRPDSAGWEASGHWTMEKDSSWLHRIAQATPASPDSLFAIMPEQLLAFLWTPALDNSWWTEGPSRQFLKPWWTGEWAAGLLPNYGGGERSPLFWVGKIRSQEALDQWLAEWASEQGELPGHPYQNFEIRQLLAEPLLPLPWSDEPMPIQNPVLVQVENYLILTDSKPGLEVWLDQYLAGQTLARAEHFLEARSHLPQKASAWGYVQADRLGRVFAKSFQPEQVLPFLEKGQLQFCLLPDGKRLKLEAVKRDREVFSSISIAWKANLDAPAITAPQSVLQGNERFWVVQDGKNELYRIASGGEVLWKKPLGSRVLSSIFPLAYYSEAPTELLFNTQDAIFLLDGRGQVVSSFPLRLQSLATNGLLLTDFSGLGDYGIFLACENGRLYGFDRHGRPLEGWNPGPEVGRVVHPVQHFQFDKKDYLACVSQEGLLHVFQRDGSYRFPPVPVGTQGISAPGVQVLPNSARIAVGDGLGKVQIVNGDGGGFTMNTPVGANEWVSFSFADVTGDERKDYVVMSGKEVAVYYYEGEKFKLWKKFLLENPQDELVTGTVQGEDKSFIGSVDGEKRQLFLWTSDGSLYPGFPLAGTSAFSIARIQEGLLLVTALDSDVYAYLIGE